MRRELTSEEKGSGAQRKRLLSLFGGRISAVWGGPFAAALREATAVAIQVQHVDVITEAGQFLSQEYRKPKHKDQFAKTLPASLVGRLMCPHGGARMQAIPTRNSVSNATIESADRFRPPKSVQLAVQASLYALKNENLLIAFGNRGRKKIEVLY